MSVPTTLQANSIPFAISEDNETYYNLVCLKTWDYDSTTGTTKEETQCGVFTGLQPNESSFNFELLVNTTPDEGEKSAKDVLAYQTNQTKIYARVQPATGLNIVGYGYLTNLKITASVGSLVTMTGAFSIDGDPTIS